MDNLYQQLQLNPQYLITLHALVAAVLGVAMFYLRSPLFVALSFLGVLLTTAGIYLLLNETFIAAIQLIVYAGAIVVLFIFSIMLFNLQAKMQKQKPLMLLLSTLLGVVLFASFSLALLQLTTSQSITSNLTITATTAESIALYLFTHNYLLFEVISLVLLVATIAAVVLAKRYIALPASEEQEQAQEQKQEQEQGENQR
ncbi:MAG: NADH-quinone oxidoreductase subunit J [Oligoflexia bacterium]|nr:NADH-quinone oxidoreductase subunit J [Oligoflexia bacterium]MBF0364099.1 NADH-quinone oxidoreductase subunit J [Oligoflexia bacterium]